MFTRKALNDHIKSFLDDLKQSGYRPSRVVLFGSYAYGRPNELSDIDLAVWDDKFTGCGSIDIEPITAIVSKFPMLELHTFGPGDKEENNPFVKEIINKGKLIFESEPAGQQTV